ncbi:S9 family peptidase [Opitutales bacterium ASA1]|uniref:prolyl oligopeptidase family serine peptidase n=1 Tax=Congregicoccus parvus TaxID=3081749 RepID=UPI002B31B3FD|nr:S9 family peptidase [Opitutales bacterium ASA1]
MNRKSLPQRLAALLVALAGSIGGATAAEPTPRFTALDVFELEFAASPQISPDGRTIAYVRRSMDVMEDRSRANVWTLDPATGAHRPLLSGRAGYGSPRWSPDGTRLAYLTAVEGRQQLHVRWMDTGQTALVTNLPHAPGAIAWSPDGYTIAFTMSVPGEAPPLVPPRTPPPGATWGKPAKTIDRVVYRADGAGYLEVEYTHVFVVPADGGTPRRLTSGDFNHDGPLAWTRDGRSILFSANRNADWEYEPMVSQLWSVDVSTGELRKLVERAGTNHSPVVSPDGTHVAFLGHEDDLRSYQVDRLRVARIDGTGERVLSATVDSDAESPVWAADGSGVYFSYDHRGEKLLAFAELDGPVRTLDVRIGGSSLGRPYTGGDFAVGPKGEVVFTVQRTDRPADLSLLSPDGSTRALTALNEDLLGHKTLGEVRELTWKSSFDGREIQGWLVLPPDFDPAKKHPLVLEIHGGPHTAYGPVFAAELQAFASAGYVVLYANPRGSTSYGAEFANLIHHRYPSEDYDDLVSGVDAAIALGFVDPDALYVTGGSGGGVLTTWIVGKTHRFRAAVVAKPVINWTSFVLTADFTPYFQKYWFGKFPWEDPEGYWRRSPLSLAGEIETPTLVIVGDADHRTPVSESEQLYQALKLRRIDTALVRIPDSPHSMEARPSQLVSKIDHILAWFARHRKSAESTE